MSLLIAPAWLEMTALSAIRRHPREAAGHRRVRVAAGHGEGPQHRAPSFEAAARSASAWTRGRRAPGPTQRRGSASIRRAQVVARRLAELPAEDGQRPGDHRAAGGGQLLEHELVEAAEHVAASRVVAAPPRLDRGDVQVVPEQLLGQPRAGTAAGPGSRARQRAERVDHRHGAAAARVDQPGHAEAASRAAARAGRSTTASTRRRMTSTCSRRPSERSQTRPSLHGEVGTLDQRVAEVARRGTRARTTVSLSGPGVSTTMRGSSVPGGAAASSAARSVRKNGARRCTCAVAVEAREDPRGDHAVLERVPGTRTGPAPGRRARRGCRRPRGRGRTPTVTSCIGAGDADLVALARRKPGSAKTSSAGSSSRAEAGRGRRRGR